MEVIETKLNSIKDGLPKIKNVKYPQPNNPDLPSHYNVSIYCGARGSGKTYTAVKYLHELEKCGIEGNIPMRIVLISPTAKSDSNKIFSILKSIDDTDIIEEYTDDILKDKIAELRSDLNEANDYKAYIKTYNKFIKIDNVNKLNDEELHLLVKYNFDEIENIKKPKYPNGFMTFLFIDDMACSSIYKNGKSYLNNLVIKNRHNSDIYIPLNIIMCVQSIFNIPKTIRINTNFICLFKYGNKKVILEDLYVLVSAYLTPEEFEKLYEYATDEPHSSLIIDLTKNKPIFKKGLNTILEIKKS